MRHTKKRSTVIGLIAVLIASVGAYAYWTQTGAGGGTASTGSGSAIVVNQTSVITNLSPGSAPQTLSGTFTNPNPGSVRVASVTATIASVSGGAGGTPACTVDDYAITDATTTVGQTINSGTNGTWSGPKIEMLDSAANQDACKGATVNVTYTSD